MLTACPVPEKSRILHSCRENTCRTPNQLAAAHCRICGGKLPSPETLPCEEWVEKAERPTSMNFEDIPQPTVAGDLFVTMQRFDGLTPKFVLTNICTGKHTALLDYPGQPGLFSSPVFVKDRIYSFAQSQRLEYGLWSSKSDAVTIPVPDFDPSPYCKPLHVAQNGKNFLVIGGQREILVFSVPDQDEPHRIPVPKMSQQDALLSPAYDPSLGVIFSTRMGGLYGVFGKDLNELSTIISPGATWLFSAPAYNQVNQSTGLEVVSAKTHKRGFLVIKDRGGKTDHKLYPVSNRFDKYPPENFSRLVFTPITSGSYFIFTSKILPGQVYFVNYEGILTAMIQGADLDEVGSVVKGTTVYCVANGIVQTFDASPTDQIVKQLAIPSRPPRAQSLVTARPVRYGDALFVQKEEALMCLRV